MTGAASRCQQWYWFQGQDQEDTDNFANSLHYIIIFLPAVWDSLSWNHRTENASLMFYYQKLNVCCNLGTFQTLYIMQLTLFSECKDFDNFKIFGKWMFEHHLFMLGTFKHLHHQMWAWKSILYIYIYRLMCSHNKGPLSSAMGPGINVPDLFFLVPPEFSLLDRD